MIDSNGLDLGSADCSGDARRVSHAGLHCQAIEVSVLCVHAVALVRDSAGVLLLGGHGTGKTLTGLAMSERGWQVAAGDVALVRVGPADSAPSLVGGTREFLVRPSAYRHWFAGRAAGPARGSGASQRIEIAATLTWAPMPADGIPLRSAVEVAVCASLGWHAQEADLDGHTPASVWYRASSYLLDRVLEDAVSVPLRCLEHQDLAIKRMTLVRGAARTLPVRWISGTPATISDAVEKSFAGFCRG